MPSYSSASPSLRNFLNSGCLFNVQAGQLTISPRTGEIGSPASSAITTVGIRRARWVIITSAINKTRDAQYLDDATVEITTEFSLCNNLFISIFDCLWSVSALEHSDSVQHYRDNFNGVAFNASYLLDYVSPSSAHLRDDDEKQCAFAAGFLQPAFVRIIVDSSVLLGPMEKGGCGKNIFQYIRQWQDAAPWQPHWKTLRIHRGT